MRRSRSAAQHLYSNNSDGSHQLHPCMNHQRFSQVPSSSSTTSGSSAGFIQQAPGRPPPTTTLRSSGTWALSWVSPGAQTVGSDVEQHRRIDARALLLRQPLALSRPQLRKKNDATFLLKSQKSARKNVFEPVESSSITEAARLQSGGGGGGGSPSAPLISAEKNISF